ncbi:MAG TPA: PHP domain-containing protein [Mycobacteriales bacterium]|nr:PHP domain-containing protein [Mycobacteriales bacterium]
MTAPRDPVDDLRRIAFLMERRREATYRVRAFRRAADVLSEIPIGSLQRRVQLGTLRQLPGIGEKTAAVVAQSLAGELPDYLVDLEQGADEPINERGSGGLPGSDGPTPAGVALRHALRGDCHTHSTWSDGGSSIREMAVAARDLGHSYLVLTDHSPRLTVANGLTADRLRAQLVEVALLNEELAPFRILTGIEVDILEDGGLDQEDDLLVQLDLVVASVHSKLRMPRAPMTERMLAAVRNPYTNVLGHCTGRMVTGTRERPESEFDPDVIFPACKEAGVAVEINSRPERLDPPKRLLRQAVEVGCVFSIDSDAHAPGQLDWLPYGCERAVACGVPTSRVVNTKDADKLLAWAAR